MSIETKLIFKNEYRWDLRKNNSILIPYLFNNDASIIITIESKSRLSKNYVSAGKLDQILIDYPNRLIASSQVLSLDKNRQVNFPQQGRFQLEFFPYQFLGRTAISVSIITNPPVITLADIQNNLAELESKVDDVHDGLPAIKSKIDEIDDVLWG
jgi:hypothetical protein